MQKSENVQQQVNPTNLIESSSIEDEINTIEDSITNYKPEGNQEEQRKTQDGLAAKEEHIMDTIVSFIKQHIQNDRDRLIYSLDRINQQLLQGSIVNLLGEYEEKREKNRKEEEDTMKVSLIQHGGGMDKDTANLIALIQELNQERMLEIINYIYLNELKEHKNHAPEIFMRFLRFWKDNVQLQSLGYIFCQSPELFTQLKSDIESYPHKIKPKDILENIIFGEGFNVKDFRFLLQDSGNWTVHFISMINHKQIYNTTTQNRLKTIFSDKTNYPLCNDLLELIKKNHTKNNKSDKKAIEEENTQLQSFVKILEEIIKLKDSVKQSAIEEESKQPLSFVNREEEKDSVKQSAIEEESKQR